MYVAYIGELFLRMLKALILPLIVPSLITAVGSLDMTLSGKVKIKDNHSTGSCSKFEFPSRVNFSGPSLYCIARTLGKQSRHSIGLAGATRWTRSDFRLSLLLLKCQGCVTDQVVDGSLTWTIINSNYGNTNIFVL